MNKLLLKSIVFTTILSGLFFSDYAQNVTFNYTGTEQTYLVPLGVTSLFVDVQGASGGRTFVSRGGYGGRVLCSLTVKSGTLLYLYVGGGGNNAISFNAEGGFNGGGNGSEQAGGGGGATDIRYGGAALSNRVVVAGGGGGGCGPTGIVSKNNDRGGDGGGLLGESGYYNGQQTYKYNNFSGSGGGSAAPVWDNLRNGSLGVGGDGFAQYIGGGGGGGGYFGGAGGDENGGGGGSSYSDPALATGVVHMQGFNTKRDGVIVITPVQPKHATISSHEAVIAGKNND